MKTYELTYILSPRLTADQVSQQTVNVEAFIQSTQGVILKSEKTGAQMLAYPIKKERSGYFATAQFQAHESAITSVTAHLHGNGDVLRSAIVVKKPVKEMKAPRRRKPAESTAFDAVSREEKKGEKADIQEIEKKLDELLS